MISYKAPYYGKLGRACARAAKPRVYKYIVYSPLPFFNRCTQKFTFYSLKVYRPDALDKEMRAVYNCIIQNFYWRAAYANPDKL